jgi:hypothetical protein
MISPKTGNFPTRTTKDETQVAFKIPYGSILSHKCADNKKDHRETGELKYSQNHSTRHNQHGKYKALKFGCGQA